MSRNTINFMTTQPVNEADQAALGVGGAAEPELDPMGAALAKTLATVALTAEAVQVPMCYLRLPT